jgi:peptidoglycan/xylan/chitin deacetylase (PgdA/CDA1 family)
LENNNAVATFFVIGSTLSTKANKNTLLRSYKMGNEIGNHTQNHANLSKLSPVKIHMEIAMADTNIKRVIGKKPAICRPPYGSTSSTVGKYIRKPQILWSIDTLDWQHLNPTKTYDHVSKNVHNGSVILMHDMYMTTAQAVRKIVPMLKKRGYQFVTVPELYAYNGKKLKANKVYRGR